MGARLVKPLFAWPLIVVLATIPPLVRFWALDGLWQPILVSGESMMPTLVGPLVHDTCNQCLVPLIAVAGRAETQAPTIVCFNCGNRQAWPSTPASLGQPVLVDRAAGWFNDLQRFDLIAFTDAQGRPTVKRVLGLPGERVGFDRGDLIIDNQRVARTVDQALASAVDVYDDRFRYQQHSRWSSSRAWHKLAAGFELPLSEKVSEASEVATLTYCHENPHNRNQAEPVTDNYPCNQHVKRMMQPVTDLILRCRIESTGPVQLSVWFFVDGRSVPIRFPVPIDGAGVNQATNIVVAYLDGRLWQRVGKQAAVVELSPLPSPSHQTSSPPGINERRPLAIVVEHASATVTVSQLRLQRDLVWWHADSPQHWQMPTRLSAGHCFVVGDNVPVSIDSRQDARGLPARQIIGRVIDSR